MPQFVAPSRKRRFLNSVIAALNSFDFDVSIKYSICTKTGPSSGLTLVASCGNGQCIEGVKSKSFTTVVLYHLLASILATKAREASISVIEIPLKLAIKPHIT